MKAVKKGISKGLVEYISASKKEPKWMKEKRKEALEFFSELPLPLWGPDLSGLLLDDISYYSNPASEEKDDWEKVPKEITDTFDALGIPKAEKEFLGGVGAQYDSGVVYHKLKETLKKKGVIFENMDVAVVKHPDLVKKYFMTDCVSMSEHKFAALHGALWSGGTFIYVPKGVSVSLPLQAYFRMNKKSSAQLEHTLIIADEGSDLHYIEGCSAPLYTSSSLHVGCVEIFVHKGASVTYSSIENWSRNTYNLNTKRAIVHEGGTIRWVNGNFGSKTTMLYPTSVLLGEGASSDSLGVVFAGKGQEIDSGARSIHLAPNTSSLIRSKSISKDGGIARYKGMINVSPGADNTSSSLVCESLVLGDGSEASAYPSVVNKNENVTISHEAKIGKIGREEIFYLKTRGLTEEEATRLIVGGFIDPILKSFPLEYALELNKLVDLELG